MSSSSSAPTEPKVELEVETEVCVLGAGPHGLAAAVHLRRARPDLDLVAVDPTGAWLAGWQEQFARAEIGALRSPIVHHPAPDPFELTEFVQRQQLPRSGLPYDPPTTDAFTSFCFDLIADAGLEPPVSARAEVVRREGGGLEVLANEGFIRAKHLVVATNPHRRSIPDWVWPLLGGRPGQFVFGSDVDLRTLPDLQGERVVIIGGGLTAGHLVVGAAARGADVRLATRRPIETRNFDTDPGWLGPRHLAAFDQDPDPVSRLHAAATARGGGTIPPWMQARFADLIDEGVLITHEACDVRAAGLDGGNVVLAMDDHTTLEADRVWLATGTTPDITACRCLADLAADVPMVDGLPITDDGLRLGPHPVQALTGVDLEHKSVVSRPSIRSKIRRRR